MGYGTVPPGPKDGHGYWNPQTPGSRQLVVPFLRNTLEQPSVQFVASALGRVLGAAGTCMW